MARPIPVSILLFLPAADSEPVCLPCYTESDERETLVKFKAEGVQIVGVYTPDANMGKELDLDKLREAWAKEEGIPLESAWNSTTSVKEQCGQQEW